MPTSKLPLENEPSGGGLSPAERYIESLVREHSRRWYARLRMEARHLIWSGGLSEADVQQMLRAQVFGSLTGATPCSAPDERQGLPVRSVLQRRLGGPLDAVPHPRNTLLCPLHERSLLGEKHVPCCKMQDPPPDPSLDLAPDRWASAHVVCCRALEELISLDWRTILGMPPWRGWHYKPDPDELRRERESVLQSGPAGTDIEKLRAQLRFLLNSQRLAATAPVELRGDSLLVTDQHWLPCRDDPHRDLYERADVVPDEEDDADGPQEEPEPYDPPPRRRVRCVFQVRAQLGDRTVPCAQALEAAPPPPDELISDERIRAHYYMSMPLLPSESDESDRPGGPEDPVRVLGIRPCYVIGRLLAHDIYPYLKFLATDRESIEADRRILTQDQELDPDAVLSAVADAEL